MTLLADLLATVGIAGAMYGLLRVLARRWPGRVAFADGRLKRDRADDGLRSYVMATGLVGVVVVLSWTLGSHAWVPFAALSGMGLSFVGLPLLTNRDDAACRYAERVLRDRSVYVGDPILAARASGAMLMFIGIAVTILSVLWLFV